MNFNPIIDKIILNEGGYVDHPDDHGGPTNFGITLAVARANGYAGDMRDLPESLARDIYLKRYITAPSFDQVAVISERIAAEMIDTGVNMGPNRPGEFLQRWLNGFNFDGSRYAELFVDGHIGNVTLDALRNFLKWRSDGELVMVNALNCIQGSRYLDLCEADKSQRKFLWGWMRERVSLS